MANGGADAVVSVGNREEEDKGEKCQMTSTKKSPNIISISSFFQQKVTMVDLTKKIHSEKEKCFYKVYIAKHRNYLIGRVFFVVFKIQTIAKQFE